MVSGAVFFKSSGNKYIKENWRLCSVFTDKGIYGYWLAIATNITIEGIEGRPHKSYQAWTVIAIQPEHGLLYSNHNWYGWTTMLPDQEASASYGAKSILLINRSNKRLQQLVSGCLRLEVNIGWFSLKRSTTEIPIFTEKWLNQNLIIWFSLVWFSGSKSHYIKKYVFL